MDTHGEREHSARQSLCYAAVQFLMSGCFTGCHSEEVPETVRGHLYEDDR